MINNLILTVNVYNKKEIEVLRKKFVKLEKKLKEKFIKEGKKREYCDPSISHQVLFKCRFLGFCNTGVTFPPFVLKG